MMIPVISEIGLYKIPKATKPIWNPGCSTPNAAESNGFPTKRERIQSVKPDS